MPAKSKAQQAAMGIAAGVKEGKVKAQKGSPSAKIAGSMNLADIKDFASTPTKGLPSRAGKSQGPPPMAQTPTPGGRAAPPVTPDMGQPMKVNKLGSFKKVR